MALDNDFRLDHVSMDKDLRRGQQILTTDSLPDLIQVNRAMTQGSLPSLHEGFDRGSSGYSDELRSADGSASQSQEAQYLSEGSDQKAPYLSEGSDQPPRNWSINSNRDVLPDETQERGRPRLAELGTEVPVRSASVGNVRGVVTDSDHEHVKVMYFVNSKACFKTVGRDEFLKELEAAQISSSSQQGSDAASPQQNPHRAGDSLRGETQSGAQLPVPSECSQAIERNSRRLNSRLAGDSLRTETKWGSENSNDENIQEATRTSSNTFLPAARIPAARGPGNSPPPDNNRDTANQSEDSANAVVRRQERGRSREKREKKQLQLGSVVSVRSASLGRHVQGIVTDLSSDLVRVQYFFNGRSCTKSLPRSAPEFDA
jgi:hypothetical protein